MRRPTLLTHCDWSISAKKRWKAAASWDGERYRLSTPMPVGEPPALLGSLTDHRPGPVLAGFDFPIGLPVHYGLRTGLEGFRACLEAFGQGEWAKWYEVVDERADLCLHRPFYPARPGDRLQEHLVTALGAASIDDLRRLCERPTKTRRAACPLFWTLGGNQVGKAAISGWRTILVPALQRSGTALWPFDGALADLSERCSLILAETYPADAYGQIGIRFGAGGSKKRQSDRLLFADRLKDWARERGHAIDPPLASLIDDGFGTGPEGDDIFDAFLGLCGMLEVVDGHRSEGAPDRPNIRRWEGGIFGQSFDRASGVDRGARAATAKGRPNESELIARYFAPLAGPGADGLRDDAASLTPGPGHDLVLTTDALVSGIHHFPDDPPASIARKALGVNLSDLAAKGAAPRGFLLTLALPDDWTEGWLQGFSEALREASIVHGCPLLGGDTVRTGGPLTVSVTALGEVPTGTMVRRRGARPGDRLCVTGTIGDAALGLLVRREPESDPWCRLAPEDRAVLLDRYLHPRPRLPLAPVLRRHARAAMDVSDGLAGDLAKMLGEGTTARVAIPDVPLSDAARRALAIDPGLLVTLLTGGDDYEVLCALDPADVEAFLADAREAGVAASAIGWVEAGEGAPVFVAQDGAEMRFATASFSHF